jgi:hypothetical protein
MDERMGSMSWEQNTLCTEVDPRERQVWNVYAPVFKLLLKMCFETEMVCATGVARKETLVVFPVVFESNATPYLEERGEQG